MIFTLIIWIYILLLAFVFGGVIKSIVLKISGYEYESIDSVIWSGIAFLTIYAQTFSLFYRVGIVANIMLICMAIVILLANFRKVTGNIRETVGKLGTGRLIAYVLLLALFAYGASRGYIHYDTGLYHAQSIHWIEDYGVVKGLGNLHNRLAYNSAAFSISALFSMPYIFGQSMHVVSGFMAWLLACSTTRIADKMLRDKKSLSIPVILVAIYYLTTIFDQMISPESDYFMTLIVLFILIKWCELIGKAEKDVTPYALLCVMGVLAVTYKLSATMILLLTIKPAVMLIKNRKVKAIFAYLGAGIVTVLPYLARNVILSGWLVYPFSGIDLFNVKWKIPEWIVRRDAAEIKVYGRGFTDAALANMKFSEWFPTWFRAIGRFNQLLFAVAALSGIVCVIWGCVLLIQLLTKKELFMPDRWLVQTTAFAAMLFWLVNAPLVRYGFVFLAMAGAFLIGNVYALLYSKLPKLFGALLWIFVSLFAVYKVISFSGLLRSGFANAYWLEQKDYENYEVKTVEIAGLDVYVPVWGDRVGYDAFPSTPYENDIRLIKDDIAQGFMSK